MDEGEHLIRGAVSRDERGEGFVLEGEEGLAAFEEVIELFELVGGVAAVADALMSGLDVDIEDQEEVGDGSEGFVLAADGGGVEAASALVGHGGEVVAIEDDEMAVCDGGVDEGLDVLFAIEEEPFEFEFGSESTGGCGLAEFFPPWAIGWFAAEGDRVAE